MAVRFTRRADADLLDCLLYGLSTFGEAQADAYQSGLRACFELIERHPQLGPARPEIRPGLRTHHHARHTVHLPG